MPLRSIELWTHVIRTLLNRMADGKNFNYVQIHSYILENHYSGDMDAATVSSTFRLVREHMQRVHKLSDIDSCVAFTGDTAIIKLNP
jgi:hypothetical protein